MNFSFEKVGKHLRVLDWPLISAVVACSVYGIFLVKSATNYLDTSRYVLIQIAAIALGIAAMIFISTFDYEHILKHSKLLYIASVVLLILTLILGSGDELGSRSWIGLKFLNIGIQPSEFIKILFVLTFARHLDAVKDNINHIKNVAALCVHGVIIIGLVLLQGDLGSALVFIFMFISMIFMSGISLWYFLGAGAAVLAASPLLWHILKPYQQQRILVGFNPELDPLDKGFQAIRSKAAIGSGNLTGAGYQNGYITQNGGLPAQRTDFIFAVAGEELGLVGALLVVFLLAFVIIRILMLARSSRDTMGGYICIGIAAMFIFQSFENIGMCLGLLPVIGITLPFFSSGGSSVFSLFVAIGVVLAVRARRDIYYFSKDEIV
ncbi:MAG: FtsW/RodA/SpoVE family cell cycle protein [Eubacteriales bacterium]